MNDLKINMLIDNDILDFEEIFIDDVNNKTTIFSCNMIISIKIRTFSKNMINKSLHVCFITIILFYSMMIILIHAELSTNKDFLFEFVDLDVSFFAHTMNSFITVIMTKNDFSKSIKIARNDRLEMIIEIQYSNAFHVDLDIQNYVERRFFRVHKVF